MQPSKNLPNIIRWEVTLLYAFGLAGYQVFSFLIEPADIDNRLLTIPLRAFVLILSLHFTLYTLMVWKERFWERPYGILLLVFWGLYASRMMLDTVLLPVPLGRPDEEYFLYGIGMCFLPTLAFLCSTDQQTRERAVRTVFFMLLVTCLLAVASRHRLLDTPVGRLRANEYLNPIMLSHSGVSLSILSAFFLIGRKLSLRLKSVLYLTSLLGLFVLGLGASRGPIVSLLTALPFLFWFAFNKKAKKKILVLFMALVALLPFLFALLQSSGSSLFVRMETFNQILRGERETESRVSIWNDAWDQFLENPLLGSSLDERYSGTYPHNVVIESFMATGICGGTAFLTVLILALKAAGQIISKRPDDAWIALLFVQALVGAMFSGALYTNTALWYLLGITLSMKDEMSTRKTYQYFTSSSRLVAIEGP